MLLANSAFLLVEELGAEKLPVLQKPRAGMEKLVLLQELGTMQDVGAPPLGAGEAPPSVLARQELGLEKLPALSSPGTTVENLAATLLSVDLLLLGMEVLLRNAQTLLAFGHSSPFSCCVAAAQFLPDNQDHSLQPEE